VPRVSSEHGEQIRSRIVESALRVVRRLGYNDATIHDVVAESGLSVGAIYTYFGGKDELFAAACRQAMEEELSAVSGELARVSSVRARFEIAVRYWFDFLEHDPGAARFMAGTWAQAGSQPRIREMLAARREQLIALAALLLREAVATGEMPAGMDLDGLARGLSAMLDGLLLQRLEEGEGWRRARAERRAMLFIDLLYALGERAPDARAHAALSA
jgi:AcrR family transcriptional regulator